MSLLPPDTIQVKRKRGVEDGPVDFLQVEGNKRFRSLSGDATWVYQRKEANADRVDRPTQPSLPVIRATKEGDENRPIKSLRRQATPAAAKADAPVTFPVPAPASVVDPANEQIRRFHLSKLDSSEPTKAGSSKKRGAPAVFVERNAKKQKEALDSRISQPSRAGGISHDAPTEALAVRPSTPISPEPMTAAAQPPAQTRYKRPGTKARTTNSSVPAKPNLPPSLLNREGLDMDELARDMEAYTLSQITKTLDMMDFNSSRISATPSPASKSRFRPRAPVQRFPDRHPDYVAPVEEAKAVAAADLMATDNDDTTDDEDYVLETYERVPASRLRDQAVPPHRVGLLVFDTEPERTEFFYGNEEDSDDEFPEDEEDENAENYHTADYPDEDLDWDDELDRNPYRYHDSGDDGFDEDGIEKDVWDRYGEAKGVPF
ncbi:hypothetical protein B0T25DRAFT_160662 [Lasiosphaeria hispida]|uniref:Transcription factor Iwr1 domain-containing protein n=1 Tax=Lasiosphaeria hispida TaxID=260671 RepID=A0AAJ0MG71_9PEZI|nr:hypothetical protein B0T25DRAFT_160662 [Lasiosphaeria hispida]